MDREMGKETEFKTRNGEKWERRRNLRREMGVNGKRDETRYIIFLTKNKKQGKKLENRGKNTKKTGKQGKKQKITRNTETRFRRGSGKC